MAPTVRRGRSSRDILVGLGGPLILIGIAYELTVFANAAVYVGPLDRAAFGWLVPMPLWSISPVLAAYLWRQGSARQAVGIAAAIAVVLGAVSTCVIYASWSATSCEYGLGRSTAELLAEALPVGAVIGLGWAVVAFETRHLIVRGHRVEAALLGTIGGFVLIFLAIGAGVLSNLFVPVCNRPL